MKEKQKLILLLLIIIGIIPIMMVCVQENNDSINILNNTLDVHTVIIDPGHGGEDGGAIAEDGTLEKDINLNIAMQTNEMFKLFGYETVIIRTTDSDLADHSLETIRKRKISDINARIKILQSNPNAVYLGIHQNYYEGSSVKGFQVFYHENNDINKQIGTAIQDYTNKHLQPHAPRKVHSTGDSIYLLRHSPIPAVMVECGFLSNANDLDLLKSSDHGTKLAMCITGGLTEFYTNARIS